MNSLQSQGCNSLFLGFLAFRTEAMRLRVYSFKGERMATVTGLRRAARNQTGTTNRSNSRVATEFAPGSLEAELSAIGKSAPGREWARIPADYFADLDSYLRGATLHPHHQ
jgi:hypothetical protein